MTTPLAPYPLNENQTVVLDGSGNGVARLSPFGARYSGLLWNLEGVAVSVTTNASEAQAACYISYGVQSNGPADLQGVTQQGSTGDTCTVTASLKPGDWVTVQWKGGDSGAVATMRVFGTVTPPGIQ